MKTGSLFSGYGGLDLAVNAFYGAETAWHVEYEAAPSKILAHHWPDVPNHGDVTRIDWTTVEPVDILTGGYPCQPFSAAGRRQGTNDERHLWPYVREAIRHLRPRLTVLENVAGHRSLGFDRVLGDLAEDGLDAQWVSVRASDVGACHRRERLFILASPADAGRDGCEGCPECDCIPFRPHRYGAPLGNHIDGRDHSATDATCFGRNERRAEPAGLVRRPDAAVSGLSPDGLTLLPTPVASDWKRNAEPSEMERNSPSLGAIKALLPTPTASDASGGGQHPDKRAGHTAQLIDYALALGTNWGKYESAIRCAESATGSPAPAPTEQGRRNPRLSAAFAEWMMMLPVGWVTDPAIGLSRNDQLKAIGNGVCPPQAYRALELLHHIAFLATPHD